MDSIGLRELADHEGPFGSVYVDGVPAAEDAGHQERLRRRAIREELVERGAPPALVDAIDDALTLPPGQPGQAIIAGADGVLIAEQLPVAPPRPVIRFSPLPYVLPLLGLREPRTPYVAVVVDRTGADIHGVDARGHRLARTVRGTEFPLHKTGGGGTAHGSIQHRVEETVRRNIRAVGREVTELADRAGATLVLVAGEVGDRAALSDALRPRGRRVIQLEGVSRTAGSDPAALDSRIRRVLREEAELRCRALEELFHQEQGRGLATQGIAATTAALREANADILLIDADTLGDRAVRVGADPTQVMPVELSPQRTWLRRADEALPLAALAGRATVVATGRDHAPAEGVGAILRHG
ncbi:hypothetical protein NDR87_02420 [Nocardia sp. CDC159]|uniref:Peptide chain release factor 1 n=1 Tax=Nocardia pulmonis TaxID=2951408 RepID=A0A9X2IUI4_9NOCA|nr:MULTISPECIES: Vms1/Ankzf1 family peptidyl-tRNA hydrolase [Nocardia]MCM6772133.1 hypothetical protein [Nocardia pulmonis]MCM6785209.1 hypothetical protein [Nocardia sp. CDC159]